MNHEDGFCSANGRVFWPEDQMAELLLLLPAKQAAELQRLAATFGVTVGDLIGRLIRACLAGGSGTESAGNQERRGAMTHTTLAAFESTLQTTNVWLNDVLERLGWVDPHRAYHALRAVLHALRDRLPVDQAAALAAQVPMLVRGFYYEGWHPHGKPVKERHRADFLAHVAAAFREDPDVDPEEVTRAVFQVLSEHVSRGEIEGVKRSLPTELRPLWD